MEAENMPGEVVFDSEDTFKLVTIDEWIAANIESGYAQEEFDRLAAEAKHWLLWWTDNALEFRRLRDAGG